jgi:hypothetical protein
MGLDTVEILMDIEEEFDISIPDEVASNLLTVGDTHRLIVDMLVAKGTFRTNALESEAWNRLVKIVTRVVSIEPGKVLPESRLMPDISRYG